MRQVIFTQETVPASRSWLQVLTALRVDLPISCILGPLTGWLSLYSLG
jgi:hypothetical protein